MKPISIIEAPLVVEAYWSGVSLMAQALREAGLQGRINVSTTTQLLLPDWKPYRDPETHILNPGQVLDYSVKIANAVGEDISMGYFPLVVGGDCTVLLGCLLALRREGRYGLYFFDGHADFYQPDISPSGETADMELGLAVGRGPEIITDLEGMRPLVRESDVVLFGFRDEELIKQHGGQDVRASNMTCISLSDIRDDGFSNAVERGLEKLLGNVESFWIHVDMDVLDDIAMPAVDYRMPGGLSFGELVSSLRRLMTTGKAIGMDVTIFNPTLDWDGSLAEKIVDVIAAGLLEEMQK
ncbi:MAG TPA: arginase family protein [Methanotrichaceae archaeon]|nr:arginase family protein [Methanotrichaceae archaeon]